MRILNGVISSLIAIGCTSAMAASDTDVPFITTPDNVTMEMLKLADVKPRDYVMDLGSGDGRIVISAARHFGARGLGVELVPDLVRKSQDNARSAGVADRAEFRVQDLFKTDLSSATVVTMYLLPEVNLQLRPTLLALKAGTRLVSHDWDMGDWKPDRTVTVAAPDKKVGLEKLSRLHLWLVPARVTGLWCGNGLLSSYRMEMQQTFQQFRGVLRRGERERGFEGFIEGPIVRATTGAAARLTLEVAHDRLHVTGAPGNLSPLKGASFRRAAGDSC